MSDKKALEARVLKCFEEVRPKNLTFSGDMLFKQDLGYESIDVVDLLFILEREFATPFRMRDFNAFVLKSSNFKSWDFTFNQLCQFTAEVTGL